MALALLGLASLVSAHTVITYPGWRGDNLHSNGTVYESSGLGIGPNNTFPYGMQWMYPCAWRPPSGAGAGLTRAQAAACP